MMCTEKWLKQQIQEIKKHIDDNLADLLKQSENIPLEKQDIDLRIGKATNFAIGEILDKVLGLLVEREKELRDDIKFLEKDKDKEPKAVRIFRNGEIKKVKEFLGDVQK